MAIQKRHATGSNGGSTRPPRDLDALADSCHSEASRLVDEFLVGHPEFSLRDVSRLHFRHKEDGSEIAFVDLVLEGGGAKGVALVGAIFAMERLGIRWRKVAGTSAGAMVAAALILCDHSFCRAKADRLVRALAAFEMEAIFDGGKHARFLMEKLKQTRRRSGLLFYLQYALHFLRGIRKLPELQRDLAINPGADFGTYFAGVCREHCGTTEFSLEELNRRWADDVARLHEQYDPVATRVPDEELMAELQVIAFDVVNSRKAVLPRDSGWYGADARSWSIPQLVRASIALPMVFSPIRLEQLQAPPIVRDTAPKEALFVDGVLVANLPLDVFDERDADEAVCPTIGLLIDETKQGEETPARAEINTLSSFAKALAVGLIDRQWADLDNRKDNDRIVRISNIVTSGRGVEVLDYDMTDDETVDLFLNGARAALAKLASWDYQDHLEIE